MPDRDAGADRRRRWISDAVLVAVNAGVVLALFGGLIIGRPDNPWLRLALAVSGVTALLLAGLWLDRHEARHESAAMDDNDDDFASRRPASGYAAPAVGADD